MKKIMIADDNKDFNSCCRNFLTKDSSIDIVTSTIDGLTTLEQYLNLRPDILLLDLDLPTLNGIEIINRLTSIPEEKNICNIIVMTGSECYRNKITNTSKIFKIIPKPCDMVDILMTIHEIDNVKRPNTINIEDINSLMLKLKFNLYTKGTKYLIDSIIIANNNTDLLYNINDLYSYVAKINNTNTNLIKWSITNSLSTMNRFVDKGMLYSLFDEYDGRKMSPKYFIGILIRHIKNTEVLANIK